MSAALIGALNGVIGDHLDRTGNPLAVTLNFYHQGSPITTSIEDYSNHYPNWKESVCIFLHGAAGSEKAWTNNKTGWNYGDELYSEFKAMPLHVRYNSGLHISENGEQLANLFQLHLHLDSIQNVIIIGHSMGGLIFRSACHHGRLHDQQWMHKVRQVYYIGSPHLGAPLEKFGAWTQSILEKVNSPYTQLVTKLINLRSNGIKDLRHGYLTKEEWEADESDAFPTNNKKVIHHLETASHFLIAGTMHDDIESVTAQWFGDMMVSKTSAIAACKQGKFNLPIADESMFIVGNHHHVKLMQSVEVYAFLRQRIADEVQ